MLACHHFEPIPEGGMQAPPHGSNQEVTLYVTPVANQRLIKKTGPMLEEHILPSSIATGGSGSSSKCTTTAERSAALQRDSQVVTGW